MKFSNEIWAVIPASSGSKSLKNKNIRSFLKKPLIAHSIISANKIRQIDKVLFSSDSKKYLSIAKRYYCDFYHLRNKKNASDKSKDIDVFKEIIQFLKKKKINIPKYFVHLRPTSPLRKSITLKRALNFFKKKNKYFSSLKSVSLNSHNSLKDYKIKNNKLCSIISKYSYNIDKVNVPKENLNKTYIGNGIIDIYKAKNIIKGKLLGNNVYPYITDEIFCDVDSKNDFKLAEMMFKTFR